MAKETKNEIANRKVREAIDALVDAISTDIKELSENGTKEVLIDIASVTADGYENDHEVSMFVNEDDKIVFINAFDSEVDIENIEVGELIDIHNAILSGRYTTRQI